MYRKSYQIKKMSLISYFYFSIEINLLENIDFNVTLLLLKLNKSKTNGVQYYGSSYNNEINDILNLTDLNNKNSGIGKLKDFF